MARITLALIFAALLSLGGCGGSGDSTPAPSATATSPSSLTSTSPAASDDGNWQEFTSEEGGYSVLMPGTPEEETIQMETDAGTVEATYARIEVDQVLYMTMYLDPPPESLQLDTDEYFRQYIENVVLKIESDSGKDIQDPTVTEITLDGNPGREFIITAPEEDLLSRHRTYLVESRQYLIQATGPTAKVSSDETTHYLDSFKLVR